MFWTGELIKVIIACVEEYNKKYSYTMKSRAKMLSVLGVFFMIIIIVDGIFF